MPAPSLDTVRDWRGRTMVDLAGDKVGQVTDIYLDDATGQPEWALVDTGLAGTKATFVPLSQAQGTGDVVQVPYDQAQVKDAPGMQDDGQLSQDEEAELYRYYGLDYTEANSDSGLPAGASGQRLDLGDGDRDGGGDDARDTGPGRDTSGPSTDDAMTRSEEELRVGTRTRERGRVRLRKYVTTEQVTTTVPVRREEVRLEREPITDANVDAATSGPAISEEEHEVTLHEEEPMVQKQAVPKERVRLDRATVVGEQQVGDAVRKEQIDLDEDVDTRDRP